MASHGDNQIQMFASLESIDLDQWSGDAWMESTWTPYTNLYPWWTVDPNLQLRGYVLQVADYWIVIIVYPAS